MKSPPSIEIAKPFGFCLDGNKLIIFLQDDANEKPDTRWGELSIVLSPAITSFLAPMTESSRKAITPIPLALRRVQNIIRLYFNLLEDNKENEAQLLIDTLNSSLGVLEGEISRDFDPFYGKNG